MPAGPVPMLLSAVTREGVEAVLRALMAVVEEARVEKVPVQDDRWVK